MSLIANEERPKLKAKRFNKFEPSSSEPETENNHNFVKRGFKRSGAEEDGNYTSKRKRICTTPSLNNSAPVKNLANNRLKKLKEKIQKSANEQEPKRNTWEEGRRKEEVLFYADTEQIACGQSICINNSEVNAKHKFDDPNFKLLNYSRKNLANERLQNIKKKLNSNTNSPLTFSQCSVRKKRERETSSKGDITDIKNTSDYDDSPSCKKGLWHNKMPLSNNCEQTSKETKVQNVFLEESSSIPYNIPIAQRISNSKTSNVVSKNNDIPTPPTPTLQKLPDTVNQSVVAEQKCDNFQSCSRQSTNLPLDNGDNYYCKMEMTASWIRNHQTINDNKSMEINNSVCEEETAKPELNLTKFDDEIEDMEWTNAEPAEDIIDPNRVQEESSKIDNIDKEVIKDPEKIKDVCVVVDTNVFISGLSKICDIVNLKTTGLYQPIVFVPWMVITELDYMKDSCSNSKLAKNILSAIKFINVALEENNPRVVGQTVFEAEKQKHIGSSPDDKIIACCLQVAEKYEHVILLSNDINLKNKAMINNIVACSSNEVMIKLMSKLGKNTKAQKIMHRMAIMCSSIICDCMKEAYGNVWLNMDLMSLPPWSLADCLKRFKKYWSSVFKEKLMKQFTKAMDDLMKLIHKNKYILDDSEQFVELTKLCVNLCIFLKDIEDCRGFVENTLNGITKIA